MIQHTYIYIYIKSSINGSKIFWNVRSQIWSRRYLGQELHVRIRNNLRSLYTEAKLSHLLTLCFAERPKHMLDKFLFRSGHAVSLAKLSCTWIGRSTWGFIGVRVYKVLILFPT
ncbi:hypothetical protein YC2023_111515 [Brassica napus]